jgi:hypothetical protein
MLNQGLTAGSPNLSELQDGDDVPTPTKKNMIDPWDEKEWWIMIAGHCCQALGTPEEKKAWKGWDN